MELGLVGTDMVSNVVGNKEGEEGKIVCWLGAFWFSIGSEGVRFNAK